MNFDPNNLFYWMVDKYHRYKSPDNKIIFCNEGSSRSSKTFDAFHFIYAFCDHNRYLKKPLEIGVFRRTLKDCREKTYEKDFKTCARIIGFYDKNSARKENTSPDYELFGNKIEFRGLDNMSEATAYDIVFVNEALEVETEYLIAGLKMRCRRLMIFDWNPRTTTHWIFSYESRAFTYFSRTTYKNNKHLEKAVISDIEEKSPWHLDDLHLPESERRPHLENIKRGTADKWYFKVYGMGHRASREGLAVPEVTWIDKFPDDIEHHGYGMDFGYTNHPSAIVHSGVLGNNLYLELLLYTPTKNASVAAPLMQQVLTGDENIWADSADPVMIADLNTLGFKVFAASKFKGSIKYGIGLINSYKVHIVRNHNFQKEQENYRYKEVGGIKLDEFVDEHNHAWDAARYACVHNHRKVGN